jgi:hypothetical protein
VNYSRKSDKARNKSKSKNEITEEENADYENENESRSTGISNLKHDSTIITSGV